MITGKLVSAESAAACSYDLVIVGTIAMGAFGIACIIFVFWQLIRDSNDEKDFNWEMEEEQ